MVNKSLLVLAGLALAGCTDPVAEGPAAVGMNSYALAVTGIPAEQPASEPFTFEMQATGAPGSSSTHIGAHFWTEPQSDPTAALADGEGCAHIDTATDVPGSYEVTCRINYAGMHYVYGHVRVEAGGVQYDFWAPAKEVEVLPF